MANPAQVRFAMGTSGGGGAAGSAADGDALGAKVGDGLETTSGDPVGGAVGDALADAAMGVALGEALHLLFEAETLGGLVLSESHGGHQRGRQHGPAGGEAQREHEAGGQAMGGTHGVSGYIAVDWDRS